MAPYADTVLSLTSSLDAIEDEGFWTLADMSGKGTLDLCWIFTGKLPGKTGSGKVEIWYTTQESQYTAPAKIIHSYFPDSDVRYGTFLLHDMTGDGKADLVFVKNRQTGSGYVELHFASAESNYQIGKTIAETILLSEDDGSFFITDRKDLVYLKTRNTSRKIEMRILTSDSNYKEITVQEQTLFDIENNGTYALGPKSAGPWPDLYFIKTRNTGSFKVEVYSASADSKWKNLCLVGERTGFDMEDNGHWLMADWSHSAQPDLAHLKTRNTPKGKTDIFVNRFAPPIDPVHTEHWMSMIRDDALLSALSIPGTHDTGARRGALERPFGVGLAEGWAVCQFEARDLREQLKGGIRFFDYRVFDDGALCHGIFTIKGNIINELKYMRDWLKDHPNECVLVSLKWEFEGARTGNRQEPDGFALWLINTYFIKDNGLGDVLYKDKTIPTLGQARGKIVLLKRFKKHLAETPGIPIDILDENKKGPSADYPAAHRSQDHYEPQGQYPIGEKIRYVEDFIKAALLRTTEVDVFYFNYCNAVKIGFLNPEQYALGSDGADVHGGVNGRLMLRLTGRNVNGPPVEGRLGVVIMDFWDNDAPRYNTNAIVNTNFRRFKHNYNKYPV